MSLPAVDENWYCEDCDLNFEYCDKPDFLFCPNCGKVLKNDMYQYNLDGLIDSLNNLGKSIVKIVVKNLTKNIISAHYVRKN